jgi:hypothetical protein
MLRNWITRKVRRNRRLQIKYERLSNEKTVPAGSQSCNHYDSETGIRLKKGSINKLIIFSQNVGRAICKVTRPVTIDEQGLGRCRSNSQTHKFFINKSFMAEFRFVLLIWDEASGHRTFYYSSANDVLQIGKVYAANIARLPAVLRSLSYARKIGEENRDRGDSRELHWSMQAQTYARSVRRGRQNSFSSLAEYFYRRWSWYSFPRDGRLS